MFASSVTIIGRIVADVALRLGGTLAVFDLCVHRPLPSGETKACYFEVKVWNPALITAMTINPAEFAKGTKVMVYGELDQEKWEKDGRKFNSTPIRGVELSRMPDMFQSEANQLISKTKAPTKTATKPAAKPAAKAPARKAKAAPVKKATAAETKVAAQMAELAKTMPELAASLGLAVAGVEEDFGA